MWIKFTKEHLQKGASGEEKFKVDQIIDIEDEDLAKSLIKLEIAEETTVPEGNVDADKLTKSLEGLIEKSVEAAVGRVTENLDEKLEKGIPLNINLKEPEVEGAFNDEEHFLKSVLHVQGTQKNGSAADQAVIGEKAYDWLVLGKAPTGQNVSNDVEGGFAVPDVMSNRIWDNIEKEPASILPLTDRYQTSGNSLKIHRNFESSRKEGTGKRFAGITTTWLDEADEIQTTKATTGKMTLELHKLGAVVYFTEQQLDDAAPVFNNRVKSLVPQAINFAVREAFINGSGVGKPEGVLKSDALLLVALEGAQGNHSIFHKNVNNMYWRNWNRGSSIWYAHPDLAQQLEFMYFNDDSTNQRPVYLPANQVVNSPFGMLYGRPVVPYEHMPDFGDVGDIAFIDWSQYATLTKVGGGVKSASSIHVRFLFEETAFRFTFRVDGRGLWTGPKEDLNGDTTRSPFIALASRTGGSTSSGL